MAIDVIERISGVWAASRFSPMKKELSLPEGHLCFGAMIVGHPRYKHHRVATRETPKIIWYL